MISIVNNTPHAKKNKRKIPLKLWLGSLLCALMIAASLFQYGSHSSLPYETMLHEKNLAPSHAHIFGTDELGRDLLSRVCQGIALSCSVGLIAFAIDMTIGVLWGTLAALAYPGPGADILNKISQALYSLPYLLIVILISVFTGTGIVPLVIAMVFMGWVQTAKVTEVLMKEALSSEYVTSARVIGASTPRIVLRHIIPNVMGPIVASALMSIPHAIFAEAFLSFLGVGIQPPVASLGSLISDALPALRFYPWRLLFPSVSITMLILSISFISDGILEMANPKLARQLSR